MICKYCKALALSRPMLAQEWIKQAEKAGWRVSGVNGSVIALVCNCIGCSGAMSLPVANLGPAPSPCSQPHKGLYGRRAFANYEGLVDEMRRRRCALGLAQPDLDAAMGLADGYTAKLESFAKTASPPTLLLWAQTLGLHITTAPAPLPPATLRVIDARRTKPYEPSQARFKHAG